MLNFRTKGTLAFAVALLSASVMTSTSAAARTASQHIDGVLFTSAERGWVVRTTYPVIEGHGRTTVSYTANGGHTWKTQLALNISSLSGGPEFFYFGSGRVILAARNGPTKIFATSDYGRTWTSMTLPLNTASVSFPSPQVGWAMVGGGAASGGGWTEIERTTDAGRSWHVVLSHWPHAGSSSQPAGGAGDPQAIWFTSSTSGWIEGTMTAPGKILLAHTTNAFRSTVFQTLRFSAAAKDRLLQPLPIQRFGLHQSILPVYANQGGLYVFLAEANGQTWNRRPLALPGSPSTRPTFSFVTARVAFTASRQEIFATTDSGRTWHHVGTVPADVSALDFVTADTGYVATLTELYRTTDGGRTWHPCHLP